MFELTKKWEATAESLPQVVDRLVSLQDLHEQGKIIIFLIAGCLHPHAPDLLFLVTERRPYRFSLSVSMVL